MFQLVENSIDAGANKINVSINKTIILKRKGSTKVIII